MTRQELMEVYKAEHERYNKTRDIQWRFNIAAWTLILVAIYASRKGELKMTAQDVMPVCITFTFLYSLAVWLLQVSMQVSRKIFVQVMKKLNEEEKQEGFKVIFKQETRLRGSKAWIWWILQIATVISLLWFFIISLRYE